MSPAVVVTMARYRPFWTDLLTDAVIARPNAATERPFSLVPYLLAVDHVAALARIIARLDGDS